jgi:hypothetical protein
MAAMVQPTRITMAPRNHGQDFAQGERVENRTQVGCKLAIDRIGTRVVINFLGELQSTDNILGPWSNVATNSPYAALAANVAKFCRAWENGCNCN